MKLATSELAIALVALTTIGVGLWMYEPRVALVVIGALVLSLTIAGRMVRRA